MNDHKAPFVTTAWIVILLVVGWMVYPQPAPIDDDRSVLEDPAGFVLVKIQAEIVLGMVKWSGSNESALIASKDLNLGTVGQRQRYQAFMIALGDNERAQQSALEVEKFLAKEGITLPETIAKTQEMLDTLASGEDLPSDHPSLVSSLGWFGSLLEADTVERDQLESSAANKAIVLVLLMLVILLAATCGFVILCISIVRAFGGSLRSRMVHHAPHHGIYVEVFAIWLILFQLLSWGAAEVSDLISRGNVMLQFQCTLIAFFGSLVALVWAKVRGLSWKVVRNDIGWHRGAGFFKELGWGLVGYIATLPILGIGVVLTIFLMFVQQFFGAAATSAFQSTGGGAHPIVVEIAHGSVSIRVMLVVLAVVAAPIVEETVFRGVLFRHLRSASTKLHLALSIVGSALLVSFIFAVIHPQSWVAIPALMALALGMNMMREMRGSIIPSMIIHGVSNGIVVSLMIYLLS